MTHSAPVSLSSSSLVVEATARLRGMMPPSGTFAIFWSLGAGEGATSTAAALRAALQDDARVVSSRVTHSHEAPVADPSSGTGHVHAVSERFDPWPNVVVRVSESNGRVYVAARAPGSDPFDFSEEGWSWVLASNSP